MLCLYTFYILLNTIFYDIFSEAGYQNAFNFLTALML